MKIAKARVTVQALAAAAQVYEALRKEFKDIISRVPPAR
jgi:hypothetical protein